MSLISRICLLVLLSAWNLSAVAYAASFPTRPVGFIIPFGPGGAVDVISRIVSEPLSKRLGQSVVVINRPGATGNIAIELTARAAKDGHTLLFSNSIPVVVNPALNRNFPIVISEALVPVAKVGATSSYILAVNSALPVRSVAELINHAKSNAGKINYASGGHGSINHLAIELFRSATGADLTHIPYQAGAAAAVVAVIGNEAQVLIGGMTSVLPHVQSGRLRALAVTSDSRIPQMPGVPTMDESGVAGARFSIWYGILAPKGTPAQVIGILRDAVNEVISSPAVKASLAKQGVEPNTDTAEQFARLIATEGTVWKDVVRNTGLAGN
jgi:tripartite-type tricarboxylate transporter receptor subunit TctC